jgi:perosamine synthetase
MAWLGHSRIGYNYRLDEMSCALGISQLKKINKLLSMREKVASYYTKKLSGNTNVILPTVEPGNVASWFVFVIQLKKGIDRDKVLQYLKTKGIMTNIYFPAIHLQPFYTKDLGWKEGDLPITEAISKQTLALPFFSELTKKEIDYVCTMLEEAIENSRT